MNEREASMWMGRLGELSRSEGGLPDPALIWWKAQWLEKQAVRARVERPMVIAQWLSLVAPVAAAVVLCAINWQGMQGMLSQAVRLLSGE